MSSLGNHRDLRRVREDFPLLSVTGASRPLVYLDNGASTQKPRCVIERMDRFYRSEYANIHRGVYPLSMEATRFCEDAREKVRGFINAAEAAEVLFVRGATEAINLVAASYGRKFLKKGDEVLISHMEHHANIVPWQRLCEEKGLTLRSIPVTEEGEIDVDEFQRLLGPRTYLVALTHVSNVLGTVNPVKELTARAHHAGAVVLIDGAQSTPHQPVDVRDLDCDFFCFSGHKMYGPTGIGVLYGKRRLLEAMDPYQSGGDMIESVSFARTTYAKIPAKFEAGTPAIAEIIGLGAAVEYLESLGMESIRRYEEELLKDVTKALRSVDGLRIIGNSAEKAALISFHLEGVHPHDVGTILAEEGIAVRAGHHCAQPLMERYGVPATTRASFSFYNTTDEIEALVRGIRRVKEIFR